MALVAMREPTEGSSLKVNPDLVELYLIVIKMHAFFGLSFQERVVIETLPGEIRFFLKKK